MDFHAAERVRRGSAHPGRETGVGVRNAARKFSIVFSRIPPTPSREGRGKMNLRQVLDKKMECPDQQVAEKVFPFSLREKVGACPREGGG